MLLKDRLTLSSCRSFIRDLIMYLRQIRTSLDNQKRDAASRFGMTEFLGCLVSGVWSVAKRDNLLCGHPGICPLTLSKDGSTLWDERRTKDVFYPLPSVQRSAKSGSCPACADLLLSRLLVSTIYLWTSHFLSCSFRRTDPCSWAADGGRL